MMSSDPSSGGDNEDPDNNQQQQAVDLEAETDGGAGNDMEVEDLARDLRELEARDHEYALKLQEELYAELDSADMAAQPQTADQQQRAPISPVPIQSLPPEGHNPDFSDLVERRTAPHLAAQRREADQQQEAPIPAVPLRRLPAAGFNPYFPRLDNRNPQDADPNRYALLMPPALWRRNLPVACYRATITLTDIDLLTPQAILALTNINDAVRVTSNEELTTIRETGLQKDILVFDMEDVRYTMQIVYYLGGDIDPGGDADPGVFCITGEGWDQFIDKHSLIAGDVLNIWRTFDTRVYHENYYVFKLTKKSIPELKSDPGTNQTASSPEKNPQDENPQKDADEDSDEVGEDLTEEQKALRKQRYIAKGKAKAPEVDPKPKRKFKPSSSGVVIAEKVDDNDGDDDDDDDDDNARRLKALEEHDREVAARWQAREYARAGLQPPPELGIPWTTNSPVNETNDPDLAFLDADDPPKQDNYDNPASQMSPRRWRREIPTYCLCAMATLSESDVDTPGAYLDLSAADASSISDVENLDDPENAHELHLEMVVYDEDDECYDMLLTYYYSANGDFGFCISAGWDAFVDRQGLQVGDELSIYRTFDPRVHHQPYFVFKVFFVRQKPVEINIESPTKKRPDEDKKDRDDSPKKQKVESSGGTIFH